MSNDDRDIVDRLLDCDGRVDSLLKDAAKEITKLRKQNAALNQAIFDLLESDDDYTRKIAKDLIGIRMEY